MKIENLEKKENVVLHRDEVSAQVIFSDATPSRSDIIKALAATTKSKQDLVIVRSLQGNYGGGSATLVAHIYKDRASLENVEREYMRTRNTVKEDKPEETSEESAEEKPAEKPAEDSKEEEKPAEDSEAKNDSKEAEKPAEEKPKAEEKVAEEKEAPAEKPADDKKEGE